MNKVEALIIGNERVITHTIFIGDEVEARNKVEQKIILDTSTRPQILAHHSTKLLAVFLDEKAFNEVIKMINSMKEGGIADFGVIEMAKIWRAIKPMLENLEIKSQ